MSPPDEWSTHVIRAEAEKMAAAERAQFGQTTDEADADGDPELWPVLDPYAIHLGFISEFIHAATEHSEADPAAVLGSFITRLSVEVGRNPFIQIGDGRQHVNLLAAIAGPTGAGRKGTSYKPVERLFQLAADDYIPARVTPGPLSSGEGLIDAVKDQVSIWVVDKKSRSGQWVVSHPGVTDKRLMVVTEEFSSALQSMAREGCTLSSIIRQIFDSGHLEPLTKSVKIKATGAHIGIIGHITFVELNGLLQDCQVHNGLINRFLWFCARRQKVLPFPLAIPDSQLHDFQAEIKAIARFAGKTGELRLSDSGSEAWAEFYPGLSESRGGFMGAILERAPALVLRLAMLFCLVDRKTQIAEEHLKTAIMLWRYCESSAHYIFGDREVRNPLAKKILRLITGRSLALTDIHRELGRNIESKAVRATLKALEEGKKIIRTTSNPLGRTKSVYTAV